MVPKLANFENLNFWLKFTDVWVTLDPPDFSTFDQGNTKNIFRATFDQKTKIPLFLKSFLRPIENFNLDFLQRIKSEFNF